VNVWIIIAIVCGHLLALLIGYVLGAARMARHAYRRGLTDSGTLILAGQDRTAASIYEAHSRMIAAFDAEAYHGR
jgi:hypothetical protein